MPTVIKKHRFFFRCMIITFLISIGFFISFNIAYADDILRDGTLPSFELIDRSSGLSNLSVSSVIQDRDGFIWFGTQGGAKPL